MVLMSSGGSFARLIHDQIPTSSWGSDPYCPMQSIAEEGYVIPSSDLFLRLDQSASRFDRDGLSPHVGRLRPGFVNARIR
jgi:hypothetical protein